MHCQGKDQESSQGKVIPAKRQDSGGTTPTAERGNDCDSSEMADPGQLLPCYQPGRNTRRPAYIV